MSAEWSNLMTIKINKSTVTDALAECSIIKKTSTTPTPCSSPLTINDEFDKLVNVMQVDREADVAMGELKAAPEKIEERMNIRLELLKNELEKTQHIAPFMVWKQGGNRILVDGRHMEYKAAVQLGLPIETIDYEFESMDEARVFVACHCLNRTHLNAPQRMLMVRQLENDIKKIAKQQYQGKRNDLSGNKKKEQFHTTKILAALANVGENTFCKFTALLDDDKYLKKEKSQEFVDRILAGTMSVHNAHCRLLDAKKKVNDTKGFTESNPDLFPESKESDGDPVDIEQVPEEVEYENPSLDDGDFHNKIICNDRVEVTKQLPDNFCNLISTSTEYNVERVTYDVPVPVLPYYAYLEKLNSLWVEYARILRDGGRLVINLPAMVSVFEENDHRPFNVPLFMDVIKEIEKLDVGLNLREVLVWNKLSPIRTHHLSYPSPKNPCYRADHEYILVFSKTQWEMTPENENAPHDLTTDIYREDSSSVLSIAPQSKGVGGHPAVYPETLVEKIIRMHSFLGDTVVDCSNGSGTTTAVAARMGRRWFGCDISKKYCKVAESRTQKAYKQFLNNIKDVDETKDETKNAA
jgi:DNA modification methylase